MRTALGSSLFDARRPRLLDLFCGAGGATKGYQLAGFAVTGVDIEPQPYYCGDEFIQADAIVKLELLVNDRFGMFDAIHASPPCQRYSTMGNRSRALKGDTAPDLLPPTLRLLGEIDTPWIVENVAGAKRHMPNAFKLSGGHFGLGVHRPRYFASNVLILAPPSVPPPRNGIGVYGRAPDGRRLFNRKNNGTYRAPRSLEEAQEAMGMDWADWHGTKEAIPPAMTEYIGRQLIQHALGVAA